MVTVYILSHIRNEDELDGYKIIGIFSSEVTARRALSTVKDKPGFRDHPNGFNVDGYELDKIFWGDGFG